jgi:hypothetical protein
MTIKKAIPVLLCGMTILGAPSARADTRDDVLSGIERCGVIHDDRTWLDCLYGAEQPMRSHLGLAPAPEFQQRLVPSQPVTPVSSVRASPAPAAAIQPLPRKKEGFFATLMGDAPPVAVSRMRSYRYEKNGAFVVALANGQQWRQVDVDSGSQASWMKPASTYLITVTQGAFGSYNLHTDDNPRIYKVEPVR